jgi:hypothetical protein
MATRDQYLPLVIPGIYPKLSSGERLDQSGDLDTKSDYLVGTMDGHEIYRDRKLPLDW